MTITARGATPTTRNIQSLEQAHVNWVLREADRRDYGYYSSPPPLPAEWFTELDRALQESDAATYPSYTLATEHGVRIRTDARPHRPLLNRLTAMQAQRGPLVLLRWMNPNLDKRSIITAIGRRALVKGSKVRALKWLSKHAPDWLDVIAAVQRDTYERTHTHAALPLAALSKNLQALITAAPHGKGGGLLLSGNVHAVQIEPTPADLEGVARYLCRYPDARSECAEGTAEWLSLADEIAENMQYGDGEQVKLTWRLHRR